MATVIRRSAIWLIVVAVATTIALVVTSCQEGPNSGDKAFKVDTADVTIDVMRDARVEVTERLNFRYSGSFTGAYRDIPLQPGVRVSAVQVSDALDGDYDDGGATELGSYDRPGTFGTTTAPDGSLRIVWHYSQQDGDRTFLVRYTLRGEAIAAKDAVVVPAAVWGDQWKFWLNHLRARIRMQDGSAVPQAVWMTPRDLGVTPQIRGGAATLALDRAKPHEQIALTASFPRRAFDSFAGAEQRPGVTVAQLRTAADAAARNSPIHRLADVVDGAQVPLLIVWTLLVGAAAMTLYRRSREHESGVGQYLHGPPEELPPAVGYALAHEGGYTDRIVLATLLDLVDRGYFAADPMEGKEMDLRLALAKPTPDRGDLTTYEREVYDFFAGLLQAGPCAIGDLKDRIPKHSETWRKRWEEMTSALRDAEGGAITWDRDLTGQRRLITLIAFVGYALILWLVWMRSGFFALPIAGLIAGLGLLYLFPATWLKRRDEASIRRGDEWAAFARWTKDFPRLDDDPPATLKLWRRILVYAVAFGTAERMIKSGRIPAPVAEQDDGWSRGVMHGAPIGAFSGSSFSSGFSSQVAPQSSSSSGGGGGGGFSGGGGGGAW